MTRKAKRRAQERRPKRWALISYEFMAGPWYLVMPLDSVHPSEKPLAKGARWYMRTLADLLWEK